MLPEIAQLLESGDAKWVIIPGWLNFPNYVFTRDMRLWSVPRNGTNGGWRKGHINKHGYHTFVMSNENGPCHITRAKLVKLIFDGPPSQELLLSNKKIELRHKNDVRSDDRLENLIWGTTKDNADDRDRNGRTLRGQDVGTAQHSNVEIIRLKEMLYEGKSKREISDLLHLPYSMVSTITGRKSWNSTLPPTIGVKLKITNTFLTLDGECSVDGPLHWSTFIRTGGCGIRCWKSSGYCDSPHSLDMNFQYPEKTIDELLTLVRDNSPCNRVTCTGGEPMEQAFEVCLLSEHLRREGYIVTLETSGYKELTHYQVSCFSCVVADLKPPSTEMSKTMKWRLYSRLRKQDYIKVVIQNREDYDWAIKYLDELNIKAQVAFGPRWGYLEPRQIAEWLETDNRFDIMLNMQLHKYIWLEAATPPTADLKLINREELLRSEH